MSIRWQFCLAISLAILSIIISSLAVYFAWQANQIAEQANQIVQEYHQMEYQINLPIISAVSEIIYDEGDYLSTERVEVINGGNPLKEFSCTTYGIIEIDYGDDRTCIPLYGYFSIFNEEFTGNSQGLLFSAFRENNYSEYLSIRGEFRDAAQKDGYDLIWISLNRILWVEYFDQFGHHWHKYLGVHQSGSYEMDYNSTRIMLDSSRTNQKTAEDMGLNCYIGELSGSELWDWYKAEILE